jgi:alpha-1,2-mannosyltransferase
MRGTHQAVSEPSALQPHSSGEAKLAIALCAVIGAYEVAVFLSTFFADGSISALFNSPGTDWIAYQQAIKAFLDGNLALIYDPYRFSKQLDQTYAGWLEWPLKFHPWVYPPTYLLILLPFGAFPFLVSYGLFEVLSFAGLAAALWRRHGSNRRLLALLVSPAAAVTLIVGQNSFLSAALLIGGFRLLERRPLLAGALLGCLSYKPQLCLMVPVALLAGRHWRALFAAAAAVVGLWLAIFMLSPSMVSLWFHFVLTTARSEQFYQSWLPNLQCGYSPYILGTLLGAPTSLAVGLQAVATGLATLAVAWVFWRPTADNGRLIVLLIATTLATPHVQAYDFVLLSAAIVLTFGERAAAGFLPGQPAALLVAWVEPMFRPIDAKIGFAMPLAILVMLAYAVRAAVAPRENGPSALDASPEIA